MNQAKLRIVDHEIRYMKQVPYTQEGGVGQQGKGESCFESSFRCVQFDASH